MEYRTLGTTGVSVSRLGSGTMMLGATGNPDHDDAVRLIHRALDAGVNLVDTADMYSNGESEEIVGKALRGRRDDVVLASKAHHPMGPDVNQRGSSRRWLMTAVDDSLRRLGTDWIDLYQVHRPDPHTRIEETLGALDDLVRLGEVRYIGTSTFPAYQLVEAEWAVERRRTNRSVTEQPPYSLLSRTVESEVLPTALRYGLGVITWSPLAGGWLTGGGALATSRRAATAPTCERAFRPVDPAEPGQVGRRRRACTFGGGARHDTRASRPGLRHDSSRGHLQPGRSPRDWNSSRASWGRPSCSCPRTSSTRSTRSSPGDSPHRRRSVDPTRAVRPKGPSATDAPRPHELSPNRESRTTYPPSRRSP